MELGRTSLAPEKQKEIRSPINRAKKCHTDFVLIAEQGLYTI